MLAYFFVIIFYLTNISYFLLHTTSYTAQKNKTSVLTVWFLHKFLQSLSLQTFEPLDKLHTCSQKHHSLLALDPQSFHRRSPGGWWWGTWGVRWCGGVFKALCLLQGTVISGGRGEVWHSQPWILVTGCWWSLPASLGIPHSGIYSQRCRSKSWAVLQPSDNTKRTT